MTRLTFNPIGYFHTLNQERYSVPRQADVVQSFPGKIILNPHCHFEEALKDLQGFDRIWVIFLFHRNAGWKPKVLPPRGGIKRGLFATRSPHRPNPIGMSCLELIEIKGLELEVANPDLLDGTPILDIKPYLVYADSFPQTKQGWLETLSEKPLYSVEWSELAIRQRKFLLDDGVLLENPIRAVLSLNPFPYQNRRIRKINEKEYEIACKSWRISYEIDEEHQRVVMKEIYSGYDHETLEGDKNSRWDDVSVHRLFNASFYPEKIRLGR